MELPFLEYVNQEENKWVTCIGVPYGSHFWQVADSSECNGNYKMALSKAKREIYSLKPSDAKVWYPTDIIPICNRAFQKSFAKVDCVQKAIAERGWGPLNYNLLTHPDIMASRRRLLPAGLEPADDDAVEQREGE